MLVRNQPQPKQTFDGDDCFPDLYSSPLTAKDEISWNIQVNPWTCWTPGASCCVVFEPAHFTAPQSYFDPECISCSLTKLQLCSDTVYVSGFGSKKSPACKAWSETHDHVISQQGRTLTGLKRPIRAFERSRNMLLFTCHSELLTKDTRASSYSAKYFL